ncbi:MAG: hypothetical protein SFT68_04240 [Rickettsiaceae bacterium]|nr:hypothetical protein [Rickettsiaceae bacterium]
MNAKIPKTPSLELLIELLADYGDRTDETLDERVERTTIDDARYLIKLFTSLFRELLLKHNFDSRAITRLTTKFRDAGRRSPPWQSGSETGNRRPQDGKDGNRQNRWLFDKNHKFYASEQVATLTEIRYILQTLSMDNAPKMPDNKLMFSFTSILGHPFEPGRFLDPIQLVPIDFLKFIENARYLESGHILPLGRGGKHTPDNATLMLKDSNRIQADLTRNELLDLMANILRRHGYQVIHS